jgi:phosphoribosylaminoimidazole carboxylase (NCAIR synthetase)
MPQNVLLVNGTKRFPPDRLAMLAAGLPVTDWLTVPTIEGVPDAAAALGDKVVVKPVFGGGQNTFVLSSPAEARQLADSEHSAQLRKDGFPLIVERFVTPGTVVVVHASGYYSDHLTCSYRCGTTTSRTSPAPTNSARPSFSQRASDTAPAVPLS